MSMSYLRTIVREGSRPITPWRSKQGMRAPANSEPVAEKTVHAFFPATETGHGFPVADRQGEHGQVRDAFPDATDERSEPVSASEERVSPDEHPGTAPRESVVLTGLSPVGPQTNHVAPLAGDTRAERTGSETSADAPSVILQSPGKGDSAGGRTRGDQERPADAMPPAHPQKTGLEARDAVPRGPAHSDVRAPDKAIPQPPEVSALPSSLQEGAVRRLQPRGAIRDELADLAVFYVTPRESTPGPATAPGVNPSDTRNGSGIPAAGPTASKSAATNARENLRVFYATPPQVGSEAGAIPRASYAEAGNSAAVLALGAEDRSLGGKAVERESIAGGVSPEKPPSAIPSPSGHMAQELPPREPLPVGPRDQAQLPLRRDESGPRLLIHRLDIQIVTQKGPEPPRLPPQTQPAAAPRVAWEGVDRHFFDRVSMSS